MDGVGTPLPFAWPMALPPHGRYACRVGEREGSIRLDDGSVILEVIVNPLVNLTWLSGLIFVLGSVVTMWPDAREQRRLAARFAGEGAVARA